MTLTYGTFYHAAYTAYRRAPRALDAWMRRRLRASDARAWAPHIVTFYRTQCLGRHVSPETRRLADRVARLEELRRMQCRRRLQRCVGAFVWRPHGALQRRDQGAALAALFTPTLDEAPPAAERGRAARRGAATEACRPEERVPG